MRVCKHCDKFAFRYQNLIKTHYTWRVFSTTRGQVDHVVNVFGSPVCSSAVNACQEPASNFGCALLNAGILVLLAGLTLFYFSIKSDAERCFFDNSGHETCRSDAGNYEMVQPPVFHPLILGVNAK